MLYSSTTIGKAFDINPYTLVDDTVHGMVPRLLRARQEAHASTPGLRNKKFRRLFTFDDAVVYRIALHLAQFIFRRPLAGQVAEHVYEAYKRGEPGVYLFPHGVELHVDVASFVAECEKLLAPYADDEANRSDVQAATSL